MANEKQLIYVNTLVKDLEFLAKHEDSFRQSVILGVVQTVKAQPTVDAVEVVRCKDCKNNGQCSIQDAMNWGKTTVNGENFCSHGERKDGEGMAEYIKQKIERGQKSICDSCFHQNVCKGIGNQPCTKCSHYQDAADVSPVVPGRWLHTEIEDDEEWGGTWHKWTCDNCGYSVGHNPNGTNYCPNCGAKMDLEASDGKA